MGNSTRVLLWAPAPSTAWAIPGMERSRDQRSGQERGAGDWKRVSNDRSPDRDGRSREARGRVLPTLIRLASSICMAQMPALLCNWVLMLSSMISPRHSQLLPGEKPCALPPATGSWPPTHAALIQGKSKTIARPRSASGGSWFRHRTCTGTGSRRRREQTTGWHLTRTPGVAREI